LVETIGVGMGSIQKENRRQEKCYGPRGDVDVGGPDLPGRGAYKEKKSHTGKGIPKLDEDWGEGLEK